MASTPKSSPHRPGTGKGEHSVTAPFAGVVVAIPHAREERVGPGTAVVVLEAMKMEHEVLAEIDGVVSDLAVTVGDAVEEGQLLLTLQAAAGASVLAVQPAQPRADGERADLRAVRERHEIGLDGARAEAVAARHERGRRTARENLADLLDADTFVEYGPLIFAAQERRRTREELIARTPADGLVGGVGEIEGRPCVAMSYDYTVLAGTQGMRNHAKKDRLFELAERRRLPVVLFAEDGGGRPGDVDMPIVAGLDCRAFALFARLSGLIPLVGIASGYCFAGNAALLGCCDVVIATKNSSIGMGGPAMIEGGNLGVFAPEEVGPMSVQVPNGTVDIAVEDEAEAVAVAKKYLSYFQGALPEWRAADQRLLRRAIPENRLRIYDVRDVIATLCDEGSVLEVRRAFGPGMVTALGRIEGKPFGIVANNPVHLAGAIDSDGSDKAARFLQLCDAFDLPVLFLCDTPGMMVGPEVEKTALVRHCSRLFVTGANLSVPFGTIVLRKAYGLGAQAMAGGSFHAGTFAISWPTGEFGGMGLEGAVKLGYRKELEAIADPAERRAAFDKMVAAAYARGKALSTATYFEVDEVIDPADSRRWIATALLDAKPRPRNEHKKRPNIDTW
jgi:acetyl-CoA carboxylase carboxyltransferase component